MSRKAGYMHVRRIHACHVRRRIHACQEKLLLRMGPVRPLLHSPAYTHTHTHTNRHTHTRAHAQHTHTRVRKHNTQIPLDSPARVR